MTGSPVVDEESGAPERADERTDERSDDTGPDPVTDDGFERPVGLFAAVAA